MDPYLRGRRHSRFKKRPDNPLESGRCKLVSLVWTRRALIVKRILPILAIIAASLARPACAQTLDDQERCATQAEKAFQTWKREDRAEGERVGSSLVFADYSSHYNTKLQKCLMLVEAQHQLGHLTQASPSGPTSSTTAALTDAYERRTYAVYVWMSRPDKKYWEVPPTSCELIPTPREKRNCATREEFDDFVARYLE
jgi:hypothetical protein